MSIRWGLVGMFSMAIVGAAAGAPEGPPCRVCHAETAGAPHAHPMADAAAQAAAHAAADAPACADCHVNADQHPARPGGAEDRLLRFDTEPAADRSAVCSSCHRDVHRGAGADVHRQAGVACDDCHRVHGRTDAVRSGAPAGFERIDRASAVCAPCHAGVFTQFTFNERHRLAEGAISCIACHDAHQSSRPSLLHHPGEGACDGCHDDKSGPFVFEHAASRVDGCTSCHESHGSPNRYLLTHQREGELCYSCHTLVPQFHVGFAPGAPPRFDERTVCTNCHTAIHGSNFDRYFLR